MGAKGIAESDANHGSYRGLQGAELPSEQAILDKRSSPELQAERFVMNRLQSRKCPGRLPSDTDASECE